MTKRENHVILRNHIYEIIPINNIVNYIIYTLHFHLSTEFQEEMDALGYFISLVRSRTAHIVRFFSIVQQIIDFFRSQDYFSFSIYFVQFLLNDRSVKSFVQKNCSLKNHSFSKVFFPKKSLFLDRPAFSADYKRVPISLYTHISILTNTQRFKEYR